MKLVAAVVVVSAILHLFPCDLEKGWKGIRVLESTRVDVEKTLGKPTKETHGEVEYETEDAFLTFRYARKSCEAPGTLLGGYAVSEGVVVQYKVRPKDDLRLTELGMSKNLYERTVSDHRFQDIEYYNRRHAVRISAFQNRPGEIEIVRSIEFSPTEGQEKRFACRKK